MRPECANQLCLGCRNTFDPVPDREICVDCGKKLTDITRPEIPARIVICKACRHKAPTHCADCHDILNDTNRACSDPLAGCCRECCSKSEPWAPTCNKCGTELEQDTKNLFHIYCPACNKTNIELGYMN